MWIYIVTLFAIVYHYDPIDCPKGVKNCATSHTVQRIDTLKIYSYTYCERGDALQRFYRAVRATPWYGWDEHYVMFDSAFQEK